MDAIAIFITGGTIDKSYNEIKGCLTFKKSSIPTILKQSKTTVKHIVKELMLVDSLDMSSTQREEIVNACKNATNNQIVITHGTDSIVETATQIAKENLTKTIVLTGAMIPYSIKKDDAQFNIGTAIAFVQTLSPGVYIAMNGVYFKWDNVEKNRALGVFQSLT